MRATLEPQGVANACLCRFNQSRACCRCSSGRRATFLSVLARIVVVRFCFTCMNVAGLQGRSVVWRLLFYHEALKVAVAE